MAIKNPFQTVFPIIYCLHHMYLAVNKISSRASVLSIDFLVIYIQRTSPWCSRCSLPSLYSPQPTASSCLEVRKLLSSRGATIKVTNKKHKKRQQHKERAIKTKEEEFLLVVVVTSPLSSHSCSCWSWWHRFSVFH